MKELVDEPGFFVHHDNSGGHHTVGMPRSEASHALLRQSFHFKKCRISKIRFGLHELVDLTMLRFCWLRICLFVTFCVDVTLQNVPFAFGELLRHANML